MNGGRSGSGSWLRSRSGSGSGSGVHNRLRGGVCNRLGSGNGGSVSRDGRSRSGN